MSTTSLTVTSRFDSSHFDPDHCGPHPHGHSFTVTATEVADLAGLCPRLARDLDAVVEPLHLHKLDDMLYGGSQTLNGMAAWIMERLLLEHPRVVRVTVAFPGAAGEVTREIR